MRSLSLRSSQVAYQGEPGAYSEAATYSLLGRNVEAIGCASFEDAFRAVERGECQLAMVRMGAMNGVGDATNV